MQKPSPVEFFGALGVSSGVCFSAVAISQGLESSGHFVAAQLFEIEAAQTEGQSNGRISEINQTSADTIHQRAEAERLLAIGFSAIATINLSLGSVLLGVAALTESRIRRLERSYLFGPAEIPYGSDNCVPGGKTIVISWDSR